MPKLLTNTFNLTQFNNTGPQPKGYELYHGSTKFTPLKLNARSTFDVTAMNGTKTVAQSDFNIADLLPPCVSDLSILLEILKSAEIGEALDVIIAF